MCRIGDTLFVAGNFLSFGPPSGGGVPTDPVTGDPAPNYPAVAGWVNCAVADGGGGWFIGGRFRGVGGLRRRNLAHILANGSVAPWGPETDGMVTAISLAGSTLYVGGMFETVGGQRRMGLAAVDAMTATVKAWDPRPLLGRFAGLPFAVLATDGAIYVGGNFDSIGGAGRFGFAALDVRSGTALPWDLKPNGLVYALAVHGDRLYLGGQFQLIAGAQRQLIAAVDLRTDSLVDWSPSVMRVPDTDWDRGAAVLTIAPTDSVVFFGGRFNRVGGLKRVSLACVDAATGTPTRWDARADGDLDPVPGPVFSTIAFRGNAVYVGGSFFVGLGGRPFTSYQGGDFVGALDIHSGAALPWDPRPNGGMSVVCASGGLIYIGGDFTSVRDWILRHNLAALDLRTGLPTNWAPTFDGTAQVMISYGGRVYLGGQLFSVNGQARSNLAALDPVSGELASWSPACNGMVRTLTGADGRIYIGGGFSSIGGVPRSNVAAVDTVHGTPLPWNPAADDMVSRLVIRDGLVYLAGLFQHVGGQSRREVAVVDTASGLATSWNTPGPEPGGTVLELAVGDSAVYVGGLFRTIGGETRALMAALDKGTGAVLPWDAHISPSFRIVDQYPADEMRGWVSNIANSTGAIYIQGGFDRVSGAPHIGLVALDPTTAAVLDWNPETYGGLFDIRDDEVLLGGFFAFAGPIPTCGLARVPLARPLNSGEPPPPAELAFTLGRSAPNPVAGDAVIGFELQSAGRVSLELFDASGRVRRTLMHDAFATAGPHSIAWSATDLSPGLYYYRLQVNGQESSRAVVVLR